MRLVREALRRRSVTRERVDDLFLHGLLFHGVRRSRSSRRHGDRRSHCQNLGTRQIYNGEYTGTSTDGVSQTFGTYEAQLVPTVRCPNPAMGQCVFRFEGTWQTTGDTGSMAGVIGGSGVARGTLDLASGMSVAFLEGDIVALGALEGKF